MADMRMYAQEMKKHEQRQLGYSDGMQINVSVIGRILKKSRAEVTREDLVKLIVATDALQLTVLEIVLPAIAAMIPNEEQEKSIFDDYDAAEDAAAGEPERPGLWESVERNLDAIVKMAVRGLHDSYSAIQQQPILPLLDHIAYQLKEK